MRDIAKLLFGGGAGSLFDLFGPGDGEEADAVERVRRAGEWCGSTPGHAAAPGAVRNAAGRRAGRPPVTTREFRDR